MAYIGVCDFDSSDQILEIAAQFEGHRYQLMAGVMMSYKTLKGIPSKWTDIFPSSQKIKSIFVKHPKVLNTLHYADYDGIDVLENLTTAVLSVGPNIDAIQLDMVWPEPAVLAVFKKRFPHIQIVLQISGNALDQVHNSPYELINRVHQYKQDGRLAFEYALLDKSMGKGLGLDSHGLLPFLSILRDVYPNLSLAVAGGLGPDSMELVQPLLDKISNLSWDAQTRVRKTHDAKDPISVSMAAEYVKKSLILVS